MKKILLTAAIATVASGAFAQGIAGFNYSDRLGGALVNHIYGPETDNPTMALSGNTSTETPAGTQTYDGGVLGGVSSGSGTSSFGAGTAYQNGNDWNVELWGAPTTQGTVLSASQLGEAVFDITGAGTTSTIVTIGVSASKAGFFSENNTGVATITGAAAGGSVSLQLRAWYNPAGAFPAWTSGSPVYGSSPIFNIDSLTPTTGTPQDLVGLQSFNVTTATPEPSTIALGVIGASALLFRRRK